MNKRIKHFQINHTDAESSYNFPFPIAESNIPKWGCILTCYSDCPGTNVHNLKSSEQLDYFFLAYLHKIKFRLFQNIYKYLIYVLRPFKYKNTCKLCGIIQDKERRDRIM